VASKEVGKRRFPGTLNRYDIRMSVNLRPRYGRLCEIGDGRLV